MLGVQTNLSEIGERRCYGIEMISHLYRNVVHIMLDAGLFGLTFIAPQGATPILWIYSVIKRL